jgi:hypothetical protein
MAGNIAGLGFGGQAREMRGEVNTVEVPTKWFPARQERDYFCDADWDKPVVKNAIASAFDRLEEALRAGRDVALPAAGLGTERAELEQRSPRIWSVVQARIKRLEEIADGNDAADPLR